MATKKALSKNHCLATLVIRDVKECGSIGIDEGDELVAARLFCPGQQVMLFTYQGMGGSI